MRTMQIQTRRLFERVPFCVRVTLASMPGASTLEAQSIDASLGGVGLICTEPVPIGQAVTLTFHFATQSGEAAEAVRGHVTSVRCDDDAAVVGIKFTPPLDRRTTPLLCRAIESA
jgi:hypothetical protein